MRDGRDLGMMLCLLVLQPVIAARVAAQTRDASKSDALGAPALTIYNQQFAVVRQGLALELKPGQNHVEVIDITGHVEPDSVFLRSLDEGRICAFWNRTTGTILRDQSEESQDDSCGSAGRRAFVPVGDVGYQQEFRALQQGG